MLLWDMFDIGALDNKIIYDVVCYSVFYNYLLVTTYNLTIMFMELVVSG
jgi:hypothetical protein